MPNPWTKWYWADWMSDPLLRMCSVGARGLWMDILCLCAEADPPGYLSAGKMPYTMDEVSHLTRVPPEALETLLGELEKRGVFSRTARGTIYSRRMVKDHKKAETATKNGKLGGNPSLSNKTVPAASDNPTPHARAGLPLPEARKEDTPPPSSMSSSPIPKAPREKSRTKIDPAWVLSDAGKSYATAGGMSDVDIGREVGRFVNHHLAHGKTMADWDAAWRTWVGNFPTFNPPRNGAHHAQPSLSFHHTLGSTIRGPNLRDFDPAAGDTRWDVDENEAAGGDR